VPEVGPRRITEPHPVGKEVDECHAGASIGTLFQRLDQPTWRGAGAADEDAIAGTDGGNGVSSRHLPELPAVGVRQPGTSPAAADSSPHLPS
jgi:hypothetical protein